MTQRKVFLLWLAVCFTGLFFESETNVFGYQPELTREQIRGIDAAFSHFTNSTPGAALSVAQSGNILYKQGYGMANLEHNIPITPSSIFHVASVSKEFTAFSIVLLHLQGKISLDDDVRKYIPEVPDFGDTITIRHLVHHTSGLRDQWDLFFLAGWRSDDVRTQSDVLNFVNRQKSLNFIPNDEHLYSNTGYTLLASIVERVSGKSFKDYTSDNIFKPLGMENTHFHVDHSEIVKNRTQAYLQSENGSLNISIPVFDTYGATSLLTTVEDLVLWADNFRHKRVGGQGAVDLLLTCGVLNSGEEIPYAFGIVHRNYKGLETFGHGGSDAGYRASFNIIPEQNMMIVVLTNVSDGNPDQLASNVADIVLADHITESEPSPAEQSAVFETETTGRDRILSETEISAYSGKYYSEELDIIYEIGREKGRLILHAPKLRSDPLEYTVPGVFIWNTYTDYEIETYRLEFFKNEQELIGGFKITKNRVKNIRFDKLRN